MFFAIGRAIWYNFRNKEHGGTFMKLSFSTLGCPDWSFSEIVSAACDLGYNGIEIRGVGNVIDGTRIPQFSPENADRTKSMLQKKNLVIPCLDSACYMNDLNRVEDTIYEAKCYVDTAHDMSIPYVRVLADYGPEQSGTISIEPVAESIKAIAEYAKKNNVEILIETNGFFANAWNMVDLLNAVNDDAVGVLWDIHHPYMFFCEPPEQTVGMIGDLIRHVHVKDSIFQGDQIHYSMVGSGEIPIKKCVEELNAIGYDGFYSLEWVKRWDLSLEEPGIAFAAYVSFMCGIEN